MLGSFAGRGGRFAIARSARASRRGASYVPEPGAAPAAHLRSGGRDSPTDTHDEEARPLTDLIGAQPRLVMIASDLHLGPGRDPGSGAFATTENFFADEAFARWLAGHRDAASPAVLVLNGDVIDFTRIDVVPESPNDFTSWAERLHSLGDPRSETDLRREVGSRSNRFGLQTRPHESLWKLLVVLRGHPVFFSALADWIARGHGLICTKGNHDLEIHWPLIRRALRQELVNRSGGDPAAASRVAFVEDSFTLDNLYIVHGHAEEAMTRVDGPPTLRDDPSQLRYPLGSFINRYLINRMERLDPFLDNVKPASQALLALLRRRPLAIVGCYLGAWRFVLRAVIMRRMLDAAALGILFSLLLVHLAILVPLTALLWPAFGHALLRWAPVLQNRWARVAGPVGGLLFPFLLPYLIGAIQEISAQLRGPRPSPHVQAARRILFGGPESPAPPQAPRYVVMGHTHVQDSRRLGSEPGPRIYLNSGTWIPLWPRNRQDLQGRILYSYIRFDRQAEGWYTHRSLVWDDAAGAPREAVILEL
jgi:UDP-2,3-diacylglucosamine pyrophosphatase LpxH